MSSATLSPVHFEIVSAKPHLDPCRFRPCKKIRERVFEQESLETLLEEVFIYYNQYRDAMPNAEMFFDLAVCNFLRRMKIAGRNRKGAENFVEYTIKSLAADDEFDLIVNVDLLRGWETLIR